jgi:hypothetical protein
LLEPRKGAAKSKSVANRDRCEAEDGHLRFWPDIDAAALTYRDFMRTRPPAHRFDSLEAAIRAIKALDTGEEARVSAMRRLVLLGNRVPAGRRFS